MWSHLILLMRAKRALRAGRFESALSVLEDPLVRDERRARDLREELLVALEARMLERQKLGHLRLALADASRLAQLDPERKGLAERQGELERLLGAEGERESRREQQRERFERALAEGRLQEARDVLAAPDGVLDGEELEELTERLRERRRLASRALQKARSAGRKGLGRDARSAFDEARRLCSDSLTFRERLVGLSANWARERFQEVQAALEAGRPFDAAKALSEWIQSDPESEDLAEAQDLLLSVGERLGGEIRDAARRGAFAEAQALASRVPAAFGRIHSLRLLRDRVERAQALATEADRDPRLRAEALRRLRRETGWTALDAALAEAESQSGKLVKQLSAARSRLEAGESRAGRRAIDEILDRWPGCDEARELLEGLLEDERERAQRLESAREAIRECKLRGAEKQLLRLVAGGFAAETARSLLRDVARLQRKVGRELSGCRARLESGVEPELVQRGLEKVRKIQVDSSELEELEVLVARRIRQREGLEKLRRCLESRRADDLIAALRSCFEEEFFDPEDAADREAFRRVGAEIDAALHRELERGAALFVYDVARGASVFAESIGLDAEALSQSARERIERARSLADEGLRALDAKDASRAEACLDAARAACSDEPNVMRLAHRMRQLSGSEREMRDALELVDRDRDGAEERARDLGPTPRPLMSLAFELKDRIHRAGDFERGCRLEVEEAGEFLLFTEDRLRIGNASGGSYPQIPVLARIRGQHACLNRSVSFHGGVKHEVEALDGAPLRVNGRPVGSAPLQHGDEFVLGDVLPFAFRRPSPRSTATLLRLGRGFEALGTSRVLWVKQGGKDSRVWIGRGKEVHVRVRVAEPELFVWAPGPGRLSVYFAGLGDVDGAQFTGEHELQPGVQVRCGEIVFRVLPL